MNDGLQRGSYVLIRALMRRLGDEPVTIPASELAMVGLLTDPLKIEIDPESGETKLWIERPEQEGVKQ